MMEPAFNERREIESAPKTRFGRYLDNVAKWCNENGEKAIKSGGKETGVTHKRMWQAIGAEAVVGGIAVWSYAQSFANGPDVPVAQTTLKLLKDHVDQFANKYLGMDFAHHQGNITGFENNLIEPGKPIEELQELPKIPLREVIDTIKSGGVHTADTYGGFGYQFNESGTVGTLTSFVGEGERIIQPTQSESQTLNNLLTQLDGIKELGLKSALPFVLSGIGVNLLSQWNKLKDRLNEKVVFSTTQEAYGRMLLAIGGKIENR